MLKPIALGLALLAPVAVSAAEVEGHITDYAFPHEGPFGSYDTFELQRGLQVFTEVCAACHGLSYVPYRALSQPGGPALPEDQMRAYAAQFTVFDPTADGGAGADVPAQPQNYFGGSALSNAPDLSLMAKARAGFHGPYGTGLSQLFNGMGGPEYIASLLNGYEENPACAPDGIDGFYYNRSFTRGGFPASCIDEHGHHMVEGSWIAMPPPLQPDQVAYQDGTPASMDQMATDVASFLMWAAEPHLNARKQAGLTGVIFLTVLAVLLYLTNKRLWARVKHPEQVIAAGATRH